MQTILAVVNLAAVGLSVSYAMVLPFNMIFLQL